MRFFSYIEANSPGLAVRRGDDAIRMATLAPELPDDLLKLIAAGEPAVARVRELLNAGKGEVFDATAVTYLPPIPAPSKIMCVGVNYHAHSAETKISSMEYPVLFPRFASTLVAHRQPLIRPRVSTRFDYEVELVAVIGKPARHVSKAAALEHVFGYSIFNDASVRDYQMRTTQFTPGKNFDGTGAFGPELLTADELPPGGRDLKIEFRLNGKTLQSQSTSDLIFDVPTLISLLSEIMTLVPGDIIVTGTPGGVGYTREPPIFMQAGDIAECEIEHVGILRNPVVDEA